MREYKLKDLIIDWISIVEDESEPVNPEAKLLIVKSKEGKNEMEKKSKVLDFLYSLVGNVEKAETADPTESEEKTPSNTEPAQEPQYLSKADFTAEMEKFKTDLMASVTEVVTKATEVEKASRNDIFAGFAKAYKEDMETLKKGLVGEKRTNPPVLPDGPGLEDLFKHAIQKKVSLPSVNGTVVEDFIKSEIEKGTIERDRFPMQETQADRVFKLVCDMGNQE